MRIQDAALSPVNNSDYNSQNIQLKMQVHKKIDVYLVKLPVIIY